MLLKIKGMSRYIIVNPQSATGQSRMARQLDDHIFKQ
jgi:hypothetical protein